MPPRLRQILNALGPLLGLALVTALFSLRAETREAFLSGANWKIILTQTVVVAIAALGMTTIIVGGGIDLTCGSVVALVSVVVANVLVRGFPPVVVVALGLATGALIGLVNGALVAGLRMMPFIVTLGMMGVVRGLAKWLAHNQAVYAPESPVDKWMALDEPAQFWPLPAGVWLALALAFVMALVMRQTVFGRRVVALGSNEASARLCGVRVGWHKLAIYALGGLLFGCAGVVQFSRLTQGDPSAAVGLELDVIAAVVIGGASLSGGQGSITGSMLGALMMAVLRNGSSQMEWPTFMQEIIIGAVIILAVGVDRLRQRGA